MKYEQTIWKNGPPIIAVWEIAAIFPMVATRLWEVEKRIEIWMKCIVKPNEE